jgi:hypothetical protein
VASVLELMNFFTELAGRLLKPKLKQVSLGFNNSV